MKSYLGYPGKARILRAASQAELTCWALASVVVFGTVMLFAPLKQLYGKAIGVEYPLAIPWFIAVFLVLGALPGRSVASSIRNAPVEEWSVPSTLDSIVPRPAERAAMIVFRFWIFGVPMAVIVLHRVLHLPGPFDLAWLGRSWYKAIGLFMLVAFSGSAVLARVKYEIGTRN